MNGKVYAMDCPRCDQQLDCRTIDKLEVLECAGCGGAWFGEDELRRLKDRSDPDLSWLDFELWDNPDRFHVSMKPAACPSCERKMAAIDYGATGIEVDYCTTCNGVWLDSGEFEKIIGSLTEELLTKDLPGYVRASIQEAREIIAGPENPLSEWKDFLTVVRMLQYRILTENPKVSKALADLQAVDPFR
jgi:Zn-finger nucleic acid-binding protein